MPEPRPITDDELIESYIEFNPRRPGRDRAGLRDSGIEVWVLVACYQGDAVGDIKQIARDYDIPVDAVRAALAYYAREREVIDARLKLLRSA